MQTIHLASSATKFNIAGSLSDIRILTDIIVQEFRGRQIKSSSDEVEIQEDQHDYSSAKITEQYIIPIMGRPGNLEEAVIWVELDDRTGMGLIKSTFKSINLILWQAKTKTLCRTCQWSSLDGPQWFFCSKFNNPNKHKMRCELYTPRNGEITIPG